VNAEGEPKVDANNFRIAFTSKKHFSPIAMALKGEGGRFYLVYFKFEKI
jgi:hypothetical protein